MYNIGDHLFEQGELDSALIYTREAREIFKTHKDTFSEAYSLGNLGRIYAKMGSARSAEQHLNESIALLEKVPDYNSITDFLFAMAEVYSGRGLDAEAITYAERSLLAAKSYGLKNDLVRVHEMLSQLYAEVGNTEKSYEHYKSYVIYRDSIKNLETIENMANLRTESELARKQAEVDLLNTQKNNQKIIVIAAVVAFFLIMLLALGLYRRNKYIGRTKKIIEREKSRSDLLLLNILPVETAQELKEEGHVRPKKFDAVSVLFTDFANFTHYAENLSPEALVESVDFYFTRFDEIVEKYGLEKIKTVGDSYMCAAGVPFPVEDHATKTVAAAFEMLEFVEQAKNVSLNGKTSFEVRIGINSGPVIAGVVGSKKFAYDIWGDTVNIASRMEACSEVGRINISESTCRLVSDKYSCKYRGEIKVKNKGMMKMYFITPIGIPHLHQV
jgi:adenylate cyclase